MDMPSFVDILTLERAERENRQLLELPIVWNSFLHDLRGKRSPSGWRGAFRRLVKLLDERVDVRLPYRDMCLPADDEEFVALHSEPEQVIEGRMRQMGLRRWGMYSPAGDLTVTAAIMVHATRAHDTLTRLARDRLWLAQAGNADVKDLIASISCSAVVTENIIYTPRMSVRRCF